MTKKLLTFLYIIYIITVFAAKADYWTQKGSYSPTIYGAKGFTINNIGYVGVGSSSTNFINVFKSYNPGQNYWSSKATYSGTYRMRGTGISIDSLGYLGLGIGINNDLQDWWQYSPASNTWTQKADYGGGPIRDAAGFTLGSFGFVVGGGNNSNAVWKYDPAQNIWVQLSNFGGTGRQLAVSFTINGKGYVGTGYNGNALNDFWEYDAANDGWTQRASLPSTPRWAATGFSIGNKGYIGMGNDNFGPMADFWEYDPFNDSWTQKASYGGGSRYFTAEFSIGNKGYAGTGLGQGNTLFGDFWEYTPDGATGICNNQSSSRRFQLFPNLICKNCQLNIDLQNNETAEIILYDACLKKVLQRKFVKFVSLNMDELSKGIFTYEVKNQNGLFGSGKIVKE